MQAGPMILAGSVRYDHLNDSLMSYGHAIKTYYAYSPNLYFIQPIYYSEDWNNLTALLIVDAASIMDGLLRGVQTDFHWVQK